MAVVAAVDVVVARVTIDVTSAAVAGRRHALFMKAVRIVE
jgi:hypothetical protein